MDFQKRLININNSKIKNINTSNILIYHIISLLIIFEIQTEINENEPRLLRNKDIRGAQVIYSSLIFIWISTILKSLFSRLVFYAEKISDREHSDHPCSCNASFVRIDGLLKLLISLCSSYVFFARCQLIIM